MKLPAGAAARAALVDSTVLAAACLVTFLLVNKLMARVHSVSADDDLLGAMWAVLATIFVNRSSYQQSRAAAVSRTAATFISFAYCLVYLAFLPFHTWALPVLVGISALTATLIGRPGDAITAAITTAVVLVVAAVSPQGAWEQPILRLVDTVIGVAVGVGSAWLDLTVIRPRVPGLPSPSPGPPSPGPPSPGDQGG
jgi:Fusaric acid resistance protein-like